MLVVLTILSKHPGRGEPLPFKLESFLAFHRVIMTNYSNASCEDIIALPADASSAPLYGGCFRFLSLICNSEISQTFSFNDSIVCHVYGIHTTVHLFLRDSSGLQLNTAPAGRSESVYIELLHSKLDLGQP